VGVLTGDVDGSWAGAIAKSDETVAINAGITADVD